MYAYQDSKKWYSKTQHLLSSNRIEVDEIEELKSVVRFHEWRYYVLDDPIITDKEYDTLYGKLKKLEDKYPDIITSDSPTQRVSNDAQASFQSVLHLESMLSLDNSYNAEDLIDFDKSVHKLTKTEEGVDITYVVEPKFDGGSIALVYENDVLVRAATRGDGISGDDITANIKTLRSIPLRASFSDYGISRVELRGEALIKKDVFLQVNRQRAEKALPLFANPRNAAAGGLRMKNPEETAERGIEAFIYQLGYLETFDGQGAIDEYKNHAQFITLLQVLGFKVPTDVSTTCSSIHEVVTHCERWEEEREAYPYEIDGMVVKVNNLSFQKIMGATSHHPRWAIAFKFKAKQATSTLLDVEFQVGKIGSITPVAKIAPVQLAGVTISSISLHNQDFIVEKGLRIHDTVLVERAGDVIPYIVKSFPELRDETSKKIQFPTECPVCQHPIYRTEGEAAWRCINMKCEAQVMQRMIHFVSKNAMNIDGLGPSYLERFRAEKWLDSIADIYRLQMSQIASLKDFGEKSAENIIAAINQSKSSPIKRLLHGLSIHHVGQKVSSILAGQINHVLELKEWTEEKFISIKDIGPVVAHNIMQYFQDEANVDLLQDLERLGVNLTQTKEDQPVQVSNAAPLVGKAILFTGSLQSLTRKEAQNIAEESGARNISAVSSKLDILVVGENAGSKLIKAQKLGNIKIMTETEFLDLFKG